MEPDESRDPDEWPDWLRDLCDGDPAFGGPGARAPPPGAVGVTPVVPVRPEPPAVLEAPAPRVEAPPPAPETVGPPHAPVATVIPPVFPRVVPISTPRPRVRPGARPGTAREKQRESEPGYIIYGQQKLKPTKKKKLSFQ